MAFGKENKKSDLKAYSLKIKTKDLPKPEFVVSERRGDKFEELPERENTVTGTLIGLEPKETVWQGKTIKSVSATLTDNDQIYFLTIPYSNLGRGLMNSLLNLQSFNDVEIGLYQTKPKVEGGKTYPAVSVRQGGEIVRWKYENKDLPPPEEIKFKGEIMRDFSKLESVLAEKLKEFNKVIKNTAPVKTKEAVSAESSAPAADDVELEPPF